MVQASETHIETLTTVDRDLITFTLFTRYDDDDVECLRPVYYIFSFFALVFKTRHDTILCYVMLFYEESSLYT